MKTFDTLTFGSVVLDMIIPIPEDSGVDILETDHTDFFQIPLGEKIKINESLTLCGGGSANASVGFAKLGLKTAAFGVLGDRSNRHFLVSELKAQGVCTDYLTTANHQQSSFSVVLCAHTGKRTVLHRRSTSKNFNETILNQAPKTKSIYISHLYPGGDRILESLPSWQSKNKAIIGWNPGETQFKKGFSAFEKIFPSIDILILNVEEAERFTGLKAHQILAADSDASIVGKKILGHSECTTTSLSDVRPLAKKFMSAGVKTVVITDGGRGAQIFNKDNHFYSPAQKAKRVDTLGAGDAFSVGVLTAKLKGKSLKEQILWGNFNANSVIQKYGAQAGQLNLETMEKLVP